MSPHGEVLAETPAGMGRGRWYLSRAAGNGAGHGCSGQTPGLQRDTSGDK